MPRKSSTAPFFSFSICSNTRFPLYQSQEYRTILYLIVASDHQIPCTVVTPRKSNGVMHRFTVSTCFTDMGPPRPPPPALLRIFPFALPTDFGQHRQRGQMGREFFFFLGFLIRWRTRLQEGAGISCPHPLYTWLLLPTTAGGRAVALLLVITPLSR